VSALDFLTPAAASDKVVAKTPMERVARAAGARFERRDGWNVAVDYGESPVERTRIERTVGFVDRSWMRKLELHGEALRSLGLTLGTAERRADGAWWCPVTPTRVLVLDPTHPPPNHRAHPPPTAPASDLELPDGVRTVDVTCGLAAMTLVGPGCRELLARFCAIDVRPAVAPVNAFRPGSVARTPGYVLVEAPDQLLVMVGWALGEYVWEVVADAAEHLGGGPVGVGALAMERAHA
jgi:glycine cleavage system aminomethyltransferase T